MKLLRDGPQGRKKGGWLAGGVVEPGIDEPGAQRRLFAAWPPTA